MSSRSTERPAWGPWTFKGVARLAHAPLRRLRALEAVVAAITQGRLEWPGVLPQPLT